MDEVAAELGSLMKAKPPMNFRETLKLLSTAMDLRHAKPKLVKHGPCKEVIKKEKVKYKPQDAPHPIDCVMRLVFPVMYAVFICLYFAYYIYWYKEEEDEEI